MPPPSIRELAERRVGKTLRDKYRIERVLGAGGMATVYLAVHRNGHKVALKILHPDLASNTGQRERFVREGYVANSIEHPGAVRVLDDDVDDDGSPFLVMELLEGQTLDERRRRAGGKLDPRDVLGISHALCDVLAAAHDKGVVHRDIKPENVFITTDGTLKILDFGIARLANEEATGGVAGTPAFMPPEQALGDKTAIDARTDLWAVGATMFTLLTGELVHEASRTTQILALAATAPARRLSDVAKDIPAQVAVIVDEALEFLPEDRFEDAREMRDAIGSAFFALYGEPLSVIGPGAASHRSPRLSLHNATSSMRSTARGGSRPSAEFVQTLSADDVAGQEGTPRPQSLAPAAAPIDGGPPSAASPRPVPETSARSKAGTRALFLASASAAMLATVIALVFARSRAPASRDPAGATSACPDGRCPPATAECTTNAECVDKSGGKAAICRKDRGACVPLETADCRVHAEKGDVENDGTIWFGAMYPHGDKGTDYGRAAARAIELARRDFAGLTGGIPPTSTSGKTRPIGVVLCDDSEAPERSAKHLVDEVGAPVILGFARSKEVLDLATSELLPKGVLGLAANTASMLADIPHPPGEPRLVLRVTTSADMLNRPKRALLESVLEPLIRKRPGVIRPDEPLRVAITRVDNASGVSHADRLLSVLRWNGKSASDNADAVRQFVVKDKVSPETADKDLSPVADAIGAFAPHVIIEAGADRHLYRNIERRWPAKLRHRPYYVLADWLTSPEITSILSDRPDASQRLLSVDSVIGPPLAKFVVHHNEIFPEKIKPYDAASAPYDAFYLAAYAAIALGEDPITGKSLAKAVRRLVPPGEPIEVGQGGIYPAIKLLRAGKNIDLIGAQTSLDFDPETGDPTADFVFNCLDRKKRVAVDSGLVFRASTGNLEGALRCP